MGLKPYGSIGTQQVIKSNQRDIFVAAINRAKHRAQAGGRLGMRELSVVVKPSRDIREVPEIAREVCFSINEGARTNGICTAPPVLAIDLLGQPLFEPHHEVLVDHGPQTRVDRGSATDDYDHAQPTTFAEAFGLRHTNVISVTISDFVASPVLARGFFCGVRRKASAQ